MTAKTLGLIVSNVALLAVLAAAPQNARANGNAHAHLSGYQEVPTLSTPAEGRFKAHIDRGNREIRYQLSYEDLEGAVLQAHIHFGARALNGPIVVFLCTNLGNGPVGTQPCPTAPASITGTIKPADVLAAVLGGVDLGLAAGEFDELVDAIEAGATYANVHTSTRPGGEVRGQIR